jgi:hypothetical protein
MSGLMLAARRAGLMGRMPPEKITSRALDRLGVHRSREEQDAVATAAHFAFGAGAGSLFGAARRVVPLPPVLVGLGYGAAIWFVSYRGWVPALGILPPPDRDRAGRPASMLAAHLVYGAALGLLTR